MPQGATLDFKTIVGHDGTVHYERASAGNRSFVVPNAPTAQVDLDWEN